MSQRNLSIHPVLHILGIMSHPFTLSYKFWALCLKGTYPFTLVCKESLRWVAVSTNIQPITLAKTVGYEWINNGMASLSLNKCSVHDLNINLIGLAFRYLFKFSSYLLQEVEAARRVHGLEHMEYVGLHVRTGFEGSEQHEKYHPKLYTHNPGSGTSQFHVPIDMPLNTLAMKLPSF